jgi:hypothetical protein
MNHPAINSIRIIALSYKDSDWEIKKLSFDETTLIVGQNAAGKSRALATIRQLANMITQRTPCHRKSSWDISFLGDDNLIVYQFGTESLNGKIVVPSEQLWWNEKLLLSRTEPGTATLYNRFDSTAYLVHPPDNRLILQTYQDMRKAPYLQPLLAWARNTIWYSWTRTKSMSIPQAPATLLIDNLGDGLDYENAAKSVRSIFGNSMKNGVQLIAATNSCHMMDEIDIACWNVLQRSGHSVTALNRRSHPDLFHAFLTTGLSGFDFFHRLMLPQQATK